MKPFLEQVVDELFVQYADNIGDLCLVLPNRRAGLFIKKYLLNKITKPIFLPEIYGIEDFINHLDKEAIPDDLILLYELYKSYCVVNSEKPQSFDHFYQWGNVLLHDFNDIDYNMSDAQAVFFYLSAEKKIQEWTPEGMELSGFQKNYLQFYENLFKVYTHFKSELFKQGMAYQGMKYRYVAENINDIAESISWKKIIFIGFNALTASELAIIDNLVSIGKASIYWDSDDYYLKQRHQEAGKFLRQHAENASWGEFKWAFNHYKEDAKNIFLYPVAQNIMQVKTAGTLLSEIANDNVDITKTAVVLADENLLQPLLQSLPEDILQCNVTMGYSLALHGYHEFILQLFALYENRRQEQFYFQDIVNVLNNSYITLITGLPHKIAVDTIANIRAQKKIYYSDEEIIEFIIAAITEPNSKKENLKKDIDEKLLNEIKNIFQIKLSNSIDLLHLIISGCEKLLGENQQNQKKDFFQDKEFIYQFLKVISHLRNIISNLQTDLSLATLRQMVQQIIKNTSVAFYGEPLSGLQIMGMLETRTLDFENIILLSVNEDILPKSKLQPSFIPYDIRKAFNMPTFIERDAIFAYHFYRLLQRAKQVHIVYNTESNNFSSGEKSRFVTQIQEELPIYNPNIKISQRQINLPKLTIGLKQDLIVNKSESLIDDLFKRLAEGFSPSALSTYIVCPLKFYYQYCLEIKEMEVVSANLDAREFGEVLHKILERLYIPYNSKIITEYAIHEMQKNLEIIFEEEFAKLFSNIKQESGNNKITMQIAKKILNDYLKNEEQYVMEKSNQYQLIDCEKKVNCDFEVIANNRKYAVKLQGKIDKLMAQIFNNNAKKLIIADYKTGKVLQSDLKFNSYDSLITDPNKSKIFQLFCYAAILNNNKEITFESFQSGIVPLRDNKNLFLPVTFEKLLEIDDEQDDKKSKSKKKEKEVVIDFSHELINTNFIPLLKQLLTEILSIEVPFTATEDEKICETCVYNGICFKS